jgi:alpha-N-acetylglucosaminidase
MLLSRLWTCGTCLILGVTAQSTQGILDLVRRRLPNHVDNFEFRLFGNGTGQARSNSTNPANDNYIVSSTRDGKILVEGNSLIALASG